MGGLIFLLKSPSDWRRPSELGAVRLPAVGSIEKPRDDAAEPKRVGHCERDLVVFFSIV